MAKKRLSQKDVVLQYLKTHKSITSLQAFEKWHITRLAAVIFDLRQLGYNIITAEQTTETKFGACTYAKYTLLNK